MVAEPAEPVDVGRHVRVEEGLRVVDGQVIPHPLKELRRHAGNLKQPLQRKQRLVQRTPIQVGITRTLVPRAAAARHAVLVQNRHVGIGIHMVDDGCHQFILQPRILACIAVLRLRKGHGAEHRAERCGRVLRQRRLRQRVDAHLAVLRHGVLELNLTRQTAETLAAKRVEVHAANRGLELALRHNRKEEVEVAPELELSVLRRAAEHVARRGLVGEFELVGEGEPLQVDAALGQEVGLHLVALVLRQVEVDPCVVDELHD